MAAALTVEPLAIADVRLVRPLRHADRRGSFAEVWNRDRFAAHGIDCDFTQDNESRSTVRGTVRGLHYQMPPAAQSKLVRVLAGRIFDVAVDLRRGSASFAAHVAVELSAEDGAQLFVPTGFAHGFCTLEADTVVLYKVDRPYAPEFERGIRWDDPDLAIDWPVAPEAVVLSERDAALPLLAETADLFG